MKQTIIIALLLVQQFQVFGTTDTTTLKSKITDVTIFLAGGQVTRKAATPLKQGKTTLLLSGISPNIRSNSIQVEGTEDFEILAVTQQKNYLNRQEKAKEITNLESQYAELNDQLTFEKGLVNVYKEEKSLLLENKQLGGTNEGVKVNDLKQLADLYRARLSDIERNSLIANNNIKKLTEKSKLLKQQLRTLKAKRDLSTSEILITVAAEKEVNADLTINYLVNNTSWYPTYDLRVKDVKSPVKLVYKANVTQQSGEDWNNVNLILSTANPNQSGTKPNLSPYVLDFRQNRPSYNKAKERVATGISYDGIEALPTKPAGKKRRANLARTVEKATSVNFPIAIPYTVPNDGKEYTVDIQTHTIPTSYQYFCVPKLESDAFLMANITDWEQYHLLNGGVNLFFEGKYLGNSVLNVENLSDTLKVSLGRDKSIVVTREQINDFTSTKLIGTNKKIRKAWQIKVRNKKPVAVNLTIEDQIPVSKDKNVEVEVIELSNGKIHKPTGQVCWEFSLEPSGTKEIKLQYAVKHPKKHRLIVD